MKYVFGYHGGGGMPEGEADVAAEMAKWEAWFGSLGAAVVDGGAPFSMARTVAADGSVSDGGGTNPLTGYSIVEADSLDAAVEMARGCPVLSSGGSVEVAESIDM